jgi:hypothetical protein
LNTLHVTAPDGLVEKEALRERWLQEMFEQAARDDSGCMDEKTAISLIQKLSCSGEDTTVRIKQKLAVSNAGLVYIMQTRFFSDNLLLNEFPLYLLSIT